MSLGETLLLLAGCIAVGVLFVHLGRRRREAIRRKARSRMERVER